MLRRGGGGMGRRRKEEVYEEEGAVEHNTYESPRPTEDLKF